MSAQGSPSQGRVHHPLFARFYARLDSVAGGHGQLEHRRELLAGLAGEVVEVGAGPGANFALYPAEVTHVTAVEPEAYLRRLARTRAAQAAVAIDVVDAVADHLPLADASCDAAVVSLVLCSVADQGQALAEIRRVLRPGGELRFYEHVVSLRPGTARLEHLVDATVWPRLFGGCHTGRDTLAAIRAAGFQVETSRRFSFGVASHVIGVARRA